MSLKLRKLPRGLSKGRVTRGLDDAQTKFEKALGLSLVGFDELEAVLLEVAEPPPKEQTATASERGGGCHFGAADPYLTGGSGLPRHHVKAQIKQ